MFNVKTAVSYHHHPVCIAELSDVTIDTYIIWFYKYGKSLHPDWSVLELDNVILLWVSNISIL